MKRKTEIYVARTSSEVEIPKYESELAAGMDVKSIGRYIVFPQQKLIVNTGLVVAIQSSSSLDVRPRSGLSLNTPLEIPNSPGTIDPDYRDEVGVIIKNTSLPSYDLWKDNGYVRLWNYLEEQGMKNGFLSEEDIERLKSKFEKLYTLDKKSIKENSNFPGIYLINPGDRVAQLLMGDETEINWITEEFLTDEQKKNILDNYNEEELKKEQETIRTKHLALVKTMGCDRGGGYGTTGVKYNEHRN